MFMAAYNADWKAFFQDWLARKGLTKTEAARRTNYAVAKGTVSNWADGLLPRPDKLQAFLEFYPDEDPQAWFEYLDS